MKVRTLMNMLEDYGEDRDVRVIVETPVGPASFDIASVNLERLEIDPAPLEVVIRVSGGYGETKEESK